MNKLNLSKSYIIQQLLFFASKCSFFLHYLSILRFVHFIMFISCSFVAKEYLFSLYKPYSQKIYYLIIKVKYTFILSGLSFWFSLSCICMIVIFHYTTAGKSKDCFNLIWISLVAHKMYVNSDLYCRGGKNILNY